MDYSRDSYHCRSSHWGGGVFNSQIVVVITSYESYDKQDWDSIVEYKEWLDDAAYLKEKSLWVGAATPPDDVLRRWSTTRYPTLSGEVMAWLHYNVPCDRAGREMWCIGSDKYLMKDIDELKIFFQRKRDALSFIQKWSRWKKPIHYTQRITEIRKELDLTTMKYKRLCY